MRTTDKEKRKTRTRPFTRPVEDSGNHDWKKKDLDIDFDTKKRIKEKFGEEFMDMDKFSRQIYSYIPNISSEMVYRIQLEINNKVYMILTSIGFLLVVAVLLYTF